MGGAGQSGVRGEEEEVVVVVVEEGEEWTGCLQLKSWQRGVVRRTAFVNMSADTAALTPYFLSYNCLSVCLPAFLPACFSSPSSQLICLPSI